MRKSFIRSLAILLGIIIPVMFAMAQEKKTQTVQDKKAPVVQEKTTPPQQVKTTTQPQEKGKPTVTNKPAPQGQQNTRTMPPEVLSLHKFVGKWTGNLTFTDAKKEVSKFTTTMECHLVSNGYGVIGVESGKDPKLGMFRATYLYGFDPYEKKIHMFVVDNFDICHDHDCVWKTPDHFYIEHNSLRNGKKYQEKVDLTFKNADTIEMTETDSLDGVVTDTGTGTYTKVK